MAFGAFCGRRLFYRGKSLAGHRRLSGFFQMSLLQDEIDDAVTACPLFHLSGSLLAPGSVIEPGNFGRGISVRGWLHSLALREYALELCRKAKYADYPSRLACSFAFLTEREAVAFRSDFQEFQTHALYHVGLRDETAPTVVADMRLLAPHGAFGGGGIWPEIYWNVAYKWHPHAEVGRSEGDEFGKGAPPRAMAGNTAHREILTLSALIVGDRIG